MYLVIDIGSNTIRAVVFHLEGEKLTPVLNKKYSAGLAGYVQPDGTLSREGLDLCIDILSEIRILIDTFNFNGIYPFATASLRNISNSSQVLEEIQERCGLQIQVLTGKEEAFFDYYGASCQLTNIDGVLVDIGGGSTEILIYKNGKPQAAESINIGSLNLYNNYVKELLPTREEIKEISLDVKKQVSALGFEEYDKKRDKRPVICAVGGSARAALKLYNSLYQKEKNNASYKRYFLKSLLTSRYEKEQLTQLILKTAPERIHTLLPGVVVLYTVSKYFGGKDIVTSSCGVREGYLYYQLQKAGVLNG